MKKSLKSKYQFLLIIFFVIIVIQSTLILVVSYSHTSYIQLRNNIQMLVIFFLLVMFIYFIVMFYYIPLKYEQALKEIYQLIGEISEGKYDIDLEYKTHNQSAEITSLINALHRMMSIIIRFDSLKTEKIYEHHQRIQQLINMLPQGCLIITIIGEIVYLNDFIKKNFKELTENLNILETLLPEFLEDTFKPVIVESLKSGININEKFLEIDKIRFKINSSIVRNRKSQPVGSIYIIVKA